MVMVALLGPPPLVMMYTRSKIWKARMVYTTTRYRVVGRRRGMVMWRQRAYQLAPSTSAASYNSLGMPPMAAEYSTTPPPGMISTVLRMTAAMASSELPIHGWGATPKTLRTALARPNGFGLKIQRQTMATNMAELTSGR